MKLVRIVSVLVGLFALIFGVSLVYYFTFMRTALQKKADYRIAIFEPVSHPAIEEIAQGFKETLNKSGKTYLFDEYNANGNSTLMRAQADEIVQHNYDLVFTIGAQCSQTVRELSKKRESKTPQVFGAVDDPQLLGLVKSLENPGALVTGVKEKGSYQEQIEVLLRLKPSVKRILLIYNPAHGVGLVKDREELERILAEKNITLQAVEVAHQNEIAQKATGFLTNTDVVLVLTDNTVVAGIDSLITLCNRYGVLLYASDLNSGDKGAALAFGVREYDYGLFGAQLAKRILEDKESPAVIPVVDMRKRHIKINTKTMDTQKLVLSPEELTRVKQEGGIIL